MSAQKAILFTAEQADELARQVVAFSRPGMRVAIGDRTTQQYDRADHMADAIMRAVKSALVELGYAEADS